MTAVLPRNRQQFASIPFAHAAGTDADVTAVVRKLPRDLLVERVTYINPTGLAEHASNFASILMQYALVVADDVIESVNTTDNTVKLTAHGLETLDGPVRLTGAGLPAGLAAATDYWIIRVDANNVAFAADPHKAIAGTKIDITTAGSGVQTLVDVAGTRRVFAYYSTDADLAGADNGIPANTFIDLTLNRGPTRLIAKDTTIEFKADEDGTTNVPAGSGHIDGRWVRG